MEKIKKLFAFLILGALLFGAGLVFAADGSALTLQQQIEMLLRQIIELLRQIIQIKLAQIQSRQQQTGWQNGNYVLQQDKAVLTVNASGVKAYVSINGGIPFLYENPITLNNGDKYSVTASAQDKGGSSSSKCMGTASLGGVYTCNISVSSNP